MDCLERYLARLGYQQGPIHSTARSDTVERPVTYDDVKRWFTYHAPTADQLPKFKAIRDSGGALAELLVLLVPAGDEQQAAIWHVRQAVMAANAAIACGPSSADLSAQEKAAIADQLRTEQGGDLPASLRAVPEPQGE